MKIIRIDRRRLSRRILDEVATALREGSVVAYPTDTAYGLAAVPSIPEAVAKIYAIKGRETGKPLPVIVSSLSDADSLVSLLGKARKLAIKYWPGPLTVVAPLRSGGGRSLRALGLAETAAVRVPKSSWARALAKAAGGAITSTSANLSGQPAPYTAADVRRAFGARRHRPDIILDAGRLPPRAVSTIVRVVRDKIKILRQGAIMVGQR